MDKKDKKGDLGREIGKFGRELGQRKVDRLRSLPRIAKARQRKQTQKIRYSLLRRRKLQITREGRGKVLRGKGLVHNGQIEGSKVSPRTTLKRVLRTKAKN